MTTAQLDASDLPRVHGRHRNKVLADRRRTRAVQLVTAGLTYQQVADELGYSSKGTVHHIVRKALRTDAVSAVEEHRQVAHDRLEGLLNAVWDQATAGDVHAVQAALRVVIAECRLLGLIQLAGSADPRSAWPCCQGPATVVIRPDDCRHEGCERHGRFTE